MGNELVKEKNKIIIRLQSENHKLKKRIAELAAELENNGWISVEEQLPKEYQTVLIDTVPDEPFVYFDEWWHRTMNPNNWTPAPTRWHPMPQAVIND